MIEKETISKVLPYLKRNGRTYWDENGGTLYFDWTLSGFTVDFKGTFLSLQFTAVPGVRTEKEQDPQTPLQQSLVKIRDWPWIAVFLDGNEVPYLEQPLSRKDQEVVLFSGDDQKSHRLQVVKLTEGNGSLVGVKGLRCQGEFSYPGQVSHGGIEFIGDSITCGFGNRSREEYREFHAADENGWMTYGALTARALGMDPTLIAVSGITVARPLANIPLPYTMDELYVYTDRPLADQLGRQAEEWDFKRHQNKIVVINLGTNDATMMQLAEDQTQVDEKFKADYRSFLKEVRMRNGRDTYIICALGSIDYYYYSDICRIVETYKAETGDQRVSCFKFTKMIPLSDDVGACMHPTEKRHRKMAEELTAYLKSLRIFDC